MKRHPSPHRKEEVFAQKWIVVNCIIFTPEAWSLIHVPNTSAQLSPAINTASITAATIWPGALVSTSPALGVLHIGMSLLLGGL